MPSEGKDGRRKVETIVRLVQLSTRSAHWAVCLCSSTAAVKRARWHFLSLGRSPDESVSAGFTFRSGKESASPTFSESTNTNYDAKALSFAFAVSGASRI